MKKIFSFAKKKKGFSPNSSDTGSVLSAGYELKEKDLGKLHKAASTGDLTKLKQLVKKHDFNQLDKENRTPLHLACAYGHADIVRFLAEGKAKLNLCDNQNRSPLMKAVQCQQEQCAVTLLENDADPNLVDINGNTALHLSALIPSISMAAQLLEHKANINAENKEGCTPLILAVTENHPEMVEFLLKEGADVDADNNSKRTSLMIAASNGQISMVRLLLRYNADISLKDDKGWTADDHSVMNGHHACSHLIIEHGTKKRPQQSPSHYVQGKEKKVPLFNSPTQGLETAFTVGGPATDKDVEEDTSQTASISRASNKGGAGDSWPSTDEDEELDFSPKKQQKPNLKKLLNASQKGRKNVKTDSPDWRSEGESENENKDGTERNSCPPSTLPLTSSTLHLANPSPQSFSKPPQMTSTPLQGSSKEDYSTDEDEDGEEGEEEADAEVLENLPSLKKGSGSVGDMMLPESKATSKYVKRDLLSELGLEPAEEEDSPWDSESASESPRKFQNGSTNSAVKAQTVMHSISEETNEELFYVPSFLRGSRNYRMAKLEDSRSIGRPGGPRGLGAEEINLEKKALKTLPLSASSSPAMHVEKTDLMKELGLGDVDDLEGDSDWDSVSAASRNLTGSGKVTSPKREEKRASLPAPVLSTLQGKVFEPEGSTPQQTPAQEERPPASLSAPLPSPRSLPSRSTPQPQPRTRKMLQVKGRGEEESDWDSESDASVSSPEKSGKHQPTPAEEKASSEQNTARSKDTLLSPEEEQSESSSEPEGGLNEVSREMKAFGGSQISAELEDLERPHRQTETEKYESSQKSKTQHDSEKRNSFKKEDQKPFKVTRAVRQKISSIRGPDLTSDQDEDDVDNERIPKLSKLEVITGARHSKPQQAFFVNGDPLSVFDDSTLSEMSEDGVRAPLAVTQKNKSNEEIELADDFDDFTQSSDTATEDVESPISGYRNASLLLKQLDCGSIDSVSLVKIQNMFHEYERTIQKERGRYNLLNDKVRQLEEERRELRKSLEDTREGKSSLEHRQVELETDLNNLKFVLKQEREKQKNAVMLYEQSRDQLRKKEEQYCQELEGKQQVELTMRNLEMEMRALINNMKQLEEDRNEAQRLLTQERNARVLQEGILNNHLRKQKEIEEENKRTVTKSTEILSQLGEASDRKKDLLQQNRSLQDEVAMLKLDLDRAKAHNQQEEAKYSEENEALKEKVEDLKRDLKLNEEALAQTVFQYNSQLSALKTECSVITSKLEHEKQAKDKLETELESVRIRLTSALQEVERSQAAKADVERTLQRERDEWLRLQEKHNSEATSQRESINSLSQQLGKAEAKANSLENECHRATLSLTEKVLLLETMQREKEQAQSRLKELEASLQAEKDQMSKSLFRQETMQERLVQVQSENMLLRQQLEEAQNKGIIKEKVVTDVQDRFSDILTKLRADSEERVHMVEERSKELVAKNIELREQIYKHENEKSEREGVLRQTQQELADALKKLSMCEASLEVNTHYRNSLEEEKLTLQKEMDRMKTKLQDTEDQYIQAERRIHDLKNALDDKEREVISSSQKLQQVLSTSSGAEKTIKQLEEHMQQLEIENAKLEAASKQQTNRIEVLQKENQEAAVIRNRLEDFVTNLQGSKINLEEQLNREVQKQSMLSHNAQDSHLLWEEELKSRSKLGLRLAELEREKGDLTSQVETEKKKARKVAEMKRSAETRLDQEMKRNSELQKEMNRLRTLVKTAKKKLKDQENGEFASHHCSFRGEMDHKALETETAVARFRNKVDDLSQHLEKEELKSARLETMNSDLREQLASLKALTQGHEKLERNKRQLEEEVAKLRKHVETSMLDQSQIEQYRREAEERARQEIRQKLEEVNLFLQTQAASQEALEQIKATNEATLRNQLEQRIRDLECELSRVRSSQQDHMSQRDSTQTELERYKELYTDELRLRKSLAAKLERSNERLAEANTKLLGERQRSKSLIASSIVNGSLTAGPVLDMNQLQGSLGSFGGTLGPLNRNLSLGGSFLNPVGDGLSQNSRVEAYLAKMQNELEKNISKELDHATAELEGGSARLSPVGSAAGSLKSVNLDQDPVSRATQQYLEVLKKNYMI